MRGAVGNPSITIPSPDGEAMVCAYRKNNNYIAKRYWPTANGWSLVDWTANLATDPATASFNGVAYAAYVEGGGNVVVRNLNTGASNALFHNVATGYAPSLTVREGVLELVFWADDKSMKRVRINSGNLDLLMSETVAWSA